MEGNVRLFLLLISHALLIWVILSFLRGYETRLSLPSIRITCYYSVVSKVWLIWVISQFEYLRCSLFSNISEPWVMMLSMVLLRLLQNVSFWAFYCRYAAGIDLGVQEIVFFSYYNLHPYDDVESILVPLVGSSGCCRLTEVLLLVSGTTEMVGIRILPTSLRWQSSC